LPKPRNIIVPELPTIMEIFKEHSEKRRPSRENNDMYIFQFIYFYQQKSWGNRTP
jgi:hypothetical protein